MAFLVMLFMSCAFILGSLYAVALILPYLRVMSDRRKGRIPQGPPAYPLIGTLGLDDDAPWVTYKQWAQQYGKDGMFTFFLGPKLHLVITDPEVAKAAYKDPIIGEGRPETNLSRLFNHHALAFSKGQMWKDTRRFEIMALKDFGRGSGSKNLLESYVQNAARDLIQDISNQINSTPDQPFSTRPAVLKCVANSIASTLCGGALRSDDPRFTRITDSVNVVFTEGTTPASILNVFPWLSHIPPFRQKQAMVYGRMAESAHMMEEIIAEHRKHFDTSDVRDFIDAYLKEQQEQIKNNGDAGSFTDMQLVYMSIEMYFAGLDATLGSLQWAVLLLSSVPEVLQKCQEEIYQVLGQGTIASYADRGQLPYCEATMSEVFRIGSVDPFGLPHQCTEDVMLNGYTIPKDTTVFVDYVNIHHSDVYYKDPMVFRPERFLDDQGKFVSSPHSLPFATGRRMCSGDHFAKMIVFISMVSMIQHFDMTRVLARSRPWTDILRINGVGVHPDHFTIRASLR
ncbi:hypothetical protein RvY_06759 [Ramazzottius varieornatus]|uniref:Cytochrome P450 n=1 Tax=Ramazzottius varieornatus TaxID=947166 RepID=A0A1D1V520_RAMVA|nr:hypothetical protein RvY_06759 [Ramazzottius varieornatus]